MYRLIGLVGLAALATPPAGVRASCGHLPAATAAAAVPNDNRAPAGMLRDGVLTVRLVARAAAWRPDGPAGCALAVHAFAEEGRPIQIPGPMIRVDAGTEVRVAVRNALPAAIWIRGLQDRARGPSGALDSAELAPGASREFRFVAATPGAWFYWAGGAAARVPRSDADGQLAGAFVVDSAPNAGAARRPHRVLVLTRWSSTGTARDEGFQVNAFNGRSWPNTERLTYTVGDSVRWHVINASVGTHEMHLHGFFFRLDAKGFAIDSAPQRGIGGMRVTTVLRPGEWLSMTWSPDRPGNWLYHCHLLAHMSGAQHLARAPGASTARAHPALRSGHAHDDDMGGLVLGLDVKRSPTARATPVASAAARERVLDLFAATRAHAFGERPGYGFVLQEGPRAPAADSIRIPGTPLVLTRGEPVRITVHNRLTFPVAVHWHGIELESYYDGVGGFSGMGARIAPTIAPNDSFVVRFTPPRAGTYMYHVHGERGEELASGLYGPLLVLERGAAYDPRTDLAFVAADGGPGDAPPVFVNGGAALDTLSLVAGTTYRLRLLYITANDVLMTTLRGPDGPVPARLLAFDGHDVPSGATQVALPLRLPTGPGHTLDFAVTPRAPGEYVLVFERLAKGTGPSVTVGRPTVVPIRVQPPQPDPSRGCRTLASQRPGETGCYLTVETELGVLPEGPAYWHLYTYPSRAAAESARGPRGTVAEAFGRQWVHTIAEQRWRPAAGERVAVIGPLSVEHGKPYTARYMEAVFPPGYVTAGGGHRHSGAEAWYVLTGAQCLETPDSLIVARAGESAMVPPGPPMAINGVGPETRRAVLIVLHPTAEPWVSPATDWTPAGRCPK